MGIQVFIIILCLTAMVSYNKVYGQCIGTPLNVPVGYSSVLVTPPGYPSPGYAPNLTCAWIGSSSDSAQILFRVVGISLRCPGDTINVYDGTDITGPQLVTNECSMTAGLRSSGYKIANSGDVYTTSTSDEITNVGENGFLLYMIAVPDFSGQVCNTTEINLTATSTIQYLSSPNFPNPYPLNKNCRWRINTQDDSAKVFIKIEFIEIETEPNCGFDSLQFIEAGAVEATFCTEGTQVSWFPGQNYTSTGNTVSVHFSSDDIDIRRGFMLSYIQTGVQTTPPPDTTTVDVTTTEAESTTNQPESTTTEKPYMPTKRRCKQRH